LHGLYYAFPRGRIDRGNGTVFTVRNGNNMNRKMPTKVQIEQAFEIQGVCEWEFDSHEQCMDEDATANPGDSQAERRLEIGWSTRIKSLHPIAMPTINKTDPKYGLRKKAFVQSLMDTIKASRRACGLPEDLKDWTPEQLAERERGGQVLKKYLDEVFKTSTPGQEKCLANPGSRKKITKPTHVGR
jgi:hypothetical protein